MSQTVPILFIDASWPQEKDRGATSASSEWAQQALSDLLDHNMKTGQYDIHELRGSAATRENIERELQRMRHRRGMIVFYGHGCDCGESLYESQHEPKIPFSAALDPINHKLLSKKIMYVVACYSAKVLGPYAVTKGAVAYIGYEGALVVAVGEERLSVLGEAVNEGLRLLTQENATCIKAHHSVYARLEKEIIDCYNLHTVDATLKGVILSMNRDALVRPDRMGKCHARLRAG